MKQKFLNGEIKVKQGDIEFIMSAEVIDRDGDLIKIGGIKLENFLKNPMMFYNHNSWESIGYWRNLRIENNSLIGVPEFSNTELAKQVKQQVTDGSLRACSIGFQVLSQGMEQMGEKMVNVIYESELFECSIVTLPANQDAIRIKGEGMKDVLEGILNEKMQTLEQTLIDIKAGSELSRKNKELIQSAYDNLGKVLGMQEEEENKGLKDLELEIAKLKEQIKFIEEKKITLQEYLEGNND